ncbi:polysaccharide biosynthesis/export family protein [Bacteroides sp.]|uniref:polysaccharide biosynthesis/export family protein n=1 Tax=Bacteroides sp. TaxID=29523 RepID=UPI0025BDEE2C|nr:polysaccharide biosynthesis/export family protein [Bacteroides sp.]
MNIKTIATICLIILFTSCRTSDRIAYFQDINSYQSSGSLTDKAEKYESKICLDDQLTILVSSIDPNAVAVFNLPLTSYQSAGETNVATTAVLQPYLVDNKGYINFPVLGKIKVAGLTCNELSEDLERKISAYAKSPLVTVRIQNFRISVLGEVNSPGTIFFSNERVTILDAIGRASDLTIYGERTNVLVIRDNNGKKEYQRLDLTSSELFSSPYYYLQQNDIVYVEPNKARKGNANYSQSAQFNISVFSTIVGTASVIASLVIALLVK